MDRDENVSFDFRGLKAGLNSSGPYGTAKESPNVIAQATVEQFNNSIFQKKLLAVPFEPVI